MGISIFANELPSWFTLGLVFCTFWFGVENILLFVCDSKKFGKGRKLSGGPKGREERSNIRVREKKKKKKVMFETGRKKEKKLCSRQRGALPPPRHETNSQALNCQQSHSLYQSHVAVEKGKPLH